MGSENADVSTHASWLGNGADAAGPMVTRTPTLHEIDQHSIGLMLIWSFIVLTLVVTAFPLIAVFS
ncbi:hypothetical protein RS9916_26799 [Synechococcus sp. RS9916]|nr:hypothetical protein RS9916_26799 [Synechococcus sp. RS9916]